mgnify:CR=1 FL=1
MAKSHWTKAEPRGCPLILCLAPYIAQSPDRRGL